MLPDQRYRPSVDARILRAASQEIQRHAARRQCQLWWGIHHETPRSDIPRVQHEKCAVPCEQVSAEHGHSVPGGRVWAGVQGVCILSWVYGVELGTA